jgi:hypothetical protein
LLINVGICEISGAGVGGNLGEAEVKGCETGGGVSRGNSAGKGETDVAIGVAPASKEEIDIETSKRSEGGRVSSSKYISPLGHARTTFSTSIAF